MAVMKTLLLSLTLLAATALLSGCAAEERRATKNATGAGEAREPHDPDVEKALARLSAEDRALAEEQELCPVTGEALGSMGTPVKIAVEGEELFICCAGCEETVRESPEEYLAKLKR